ncbi:MAG: hypothetical protein COW00_15015 [Bdellovibrio sp. CG12_big_fil_rev_8_21_14_0_65_39_13]|nr:MAG: hypothetical protein COW00_15015 [Bdellovibrio sp. CG12_big_fil_rev_8_21_14_0_65_39_13]
MLKILFIILFSSQVFAQDRGLHVSFGDVQVASSRVNVDLRNFTIVKLVESKRVKVGLIAHSVQWVRDQSNLLIPRALLRIDIENPSSSIHVSSDGATFLPQQNDQLARTEIYVNLFNPGVIEIKEGEYTIGKYTLYARQAENGKSKLIDYSYAPYQLQFEGLDNDYMSVGCRMERLGKWGHERPRLMITWSTTNYTLKDGTRPPFRVSMQENIPVLLTLVDPNGREQKVKIKAQLPKRLHRLKTALGFGPYQFKSESGTESRPNRIAGAAMLYGRLELTQSSSLRLFDAVVAEKSLFNNAGFYFAYELADALDSRIEIVPLLGFQALYFRYDNEHPTRNGIILPQGAEIAYKNAFGFENYTLIAGAFYLSSSSEKYENYWVRWGKRIFWELNYISWKSGQNHASMAGLSIGIPFVNLF